MANRLHGELEGWVTAPDALLNEHMVALGVAPSPEVGRRARQLFARVLDTPGGLRIQTIHAFCESVLGRFPIEAGIPPQFTILDERDARELLRRARDSVLDTARKTPGSDLERAVTTVSSRVGEESFDDVLRALERDRARFLAVLGGTEPTDSLIRALLAVGPEDTPESVLVNACVDVAFNGVALRRIGVAMTTGSKTDRERAEGLLAWLAALPDDRSRLFRSYCSVFLTKEDAVRARLATKAIVAAHPDAEDLLGQEALRLLDALQRQRRADVARASAALVTVAENLFTAYEEEKARLNRLDYSDLILRTRALLQKEDMAPWVLFKLDGGIDHVLVDEAQDTSPEQWDIVAALTGEFFAGEGAREPRRTLFVVGDEKQSIYSFQGADPAAFDDMQQRFKESAQRAGEALVEIPLLTSYRSVPAVLQFVDRSFAAADAQAGVVRRAWEAHKTSRHDQPGLIELWDPVKKTGEDEEEIDGWPIPDRQVGGDRPEARLAHRIAALIAQWLAPGARREVLEATGQPVRESDILILVRRRNAFFDEMVLALKRAGVAVAGADRMVLSEQLAVMDLMALGRVMLLPEDDLSLAEVLKSPLVGFDDDKLFAIAWDRGKQSLWSALRERAGRDLRFVAARDFLQEQMARADLVSPFDFYAQMLGSGGRQKLLARLGTEASDPIDEFLNLALTYQRDHPASLQGFLHWLGSGRADIKRDLDQGRPEVRVMTVHGAKGLEAPIVFLPDTTALPSAQQDSLFWGERGMVRVPLWLQRKEDAVGAAAVARNQAEQRRLEEYRRLFYVAATRARDRLYIGGWGDPKPGSWYALAQRGLENGETVVVDFPQEPSVAVRRHDTRRVATRMVQPPAELAPLPAAPDWLHRPPPTEPVPPRPLTPSQPADGEPAVRSPFVLEDSSRFQRGTAIHRLLQVLPGLPPVQQDATARSYLARLSLGFSPESQQEILRAVQSVLRDRRFAAVFAAGSVAEAPIAGRLGASVISGKIDRLAVTENDVLIIDYKTNRLAPATADDVPLLYRRQMAAYWAALRRIYPHHTVRAALLWTEGPALMELPEAMLAAHAP